MLDFLGNPPLLTLSVALMCLFLYIIQMSNSFTGSVCLQPVAVLTRFQLYRIFTYPFFHGGFFHILFNMIAWFFLGKDFERSIGTLPATYNILIVIIPFSAILHSVTAFLFDSLAGTALRFECAIGLSGVLFAILVYNIKQVGAQSVSLFGFFDVPSRWYPWVLALILQFLSPGLSFLGHCSGIVLGYAVYNGYFEAITPSYRKMLELEDSYRLNSWPLWISPPSIFGSYWSSPSLPLTSSASGPSFTERMQGAWRGMTSWFSSNSTESDAAQPIEGGGQPLGSTPARPTGRVPPNSRLLQAAERRAQAASASASASTSTHAATETIAEAVNGTSDNVASISTTETADV